MKKRIGILMIAVLIGIQFFPSGRSDSDTESSSDFISTYHPPAGIAGHLQTSCYNCHSNNTDYPWYSYIQPLGWIIEHHISKGRENLNLSEFNNYSTRKKRSKLKSMINQIKNGEMPLPSYTLMHSESILSDEEKNEIVVYLDSLRKIY